jgi:hypothetical protein
MIAKSVIILFVFCVSVFEIFEDLIEIFFRDFFSTLGPFFHGILLE